jgi:hypothetical protein
MWLLSFLSAFGRSPRSGRLWGSTTDLGGAGGSNPNNRIVVPNCRDGKASLAAMANIVINFLTQGGYHNVPSSAKGILNSTAKEYYNMVQVITRLSIRSLLHLLIKGQSLSLCLFL